MAEVMVDGKMKSVDTTTITINDQTVTDSANGQVTGLITSRGLMTTGGAVDGEQAIQVNENADPPVTTATPAVIEVVERMLPIGFTYDSKDDDARVSLVHSYLEARRSVRSKMTTAEFNCRAPRRIR